MSYLKRPAISAFFWEKRMVDTMKVHFIGFGPGDPELLTIRAFKLLEEADLIIYPGSIIDEDFLSQFTGKKMDSYGLKLEQIVETIENAVKCGEKVVRVQTGDPTIYGAIGEQIRELEEKGIECEIVPGVSSVFSSASSAKMELTTPDSPGIAVIRPKGRTLEEDHLDVIASLPLTLVILLGAGKIDYITTVIGKARGFDEPCAVVYHASRSDERVIFSSLGEIEEEMKNLGIEKTATIIVGKAVDGYSGRSHLYG